MSAPTDRTKVRPPRSTAVNEFALPEGHEFGSWVIESLLGSGGFALTYLVRHRFISNKWAAIKEYLPEGAAIRDSHSRVRAISKRQQNTYSWGLQRFLEEAQLLSGFKHDNVVEVQDYFEHNNTAYMIMDYVRGDSIQDIVEGGGTFSEERLREILFPLLDALGTLHRSNVFHRDITPSNILIREDDSPVLIDFGSARYAMRVRGTGEHKPTIIYTPGYAPIEQQEQTEQGPFTDIYALGATLYYAAFHERPVDSSKRSGEIRTGAGDPLQPAHKIGAGRFSPAFLNAIDAALQLEAGKRPQTIEDWLPMFGEPPRPESMMASPAASPRFLTPRVRWLTVAAGLVLLATAVLGPWLLRPPPLDLKEVPDILAEAATELAANPLDAPTLTKARDIYLAVLNADRENPHALAGYSTTNALGRFTRAIENEELTDAESHLRKAQQELRKAGISADVLGPAWARLESDRTLVKVRWMLKDRPLAPETWAQAQQLLSDIAAIEGGASRAQSALRALAALESTQVAIDQKRFAAARARIEEAETALTELGVDELTAARERLAAAEAQWEAQRQAQIAQGLAAAQGALSHEPLTQTRLNEARVAYQGVLVLQAGHAPAQAGVAMVEKLEESLAGLEAEEFAAAEEALAEAKTHARAAELKTDVLISVQKRLTRDQAARQAEQAQQRIQGLLAQAAHALMEGPLTEGMLAKAEGFYQEVDRLQTAHEVALTGFEVVSLLRATKAQVERNGFTEARDSLSEVEEKLAEAQLETGLVARAAQIVTAAEVDWRLGEAGAALSEGLPAEDRLEAAEVHYKAMVVLRADDPRATAGLEGVAALRGVAAGLKTRDYAQARRQLGSAEARFAEAGVDLGPINVLRAQLEEQDRAWQIVLRERKIARQLSRAIRVFRDEPFSEDAWVRAKALLDEVSAIEGGASRAQSALRALAALESAQVAIDQEDFPAARSQIERAEAELAQLGIRKLSMARAILRSTLAQSETEQAQQRIQGLLAQAAHALMEGPLTEGMLAKAEGFYQEVDRLQTAHEAALAGFEVVSLLRATKAQVERNGFTEARDSLSEVEEKLAEAHLEAGLVARAAQIVTAAEVDWRLGEAGAALSEGLPAEYRLEAAEVHYKAIVVLRPDDPRATAGLEAVAALRGVAAGLKTRDYGQAGRQLGSAEARFAEAGVDVGPIHVLRQQLEEQDRTWQIVLRERKIARQLSRGIRVLRDEPFSEDAWVRARALFDDMSAIEGGESRARSGLRALAALESAQVAIDQEDFPAARSQIERAEARLARLGVRDALVRAYESIDVKLDQTVDNDLRLASQALAETPLSDDALLRAKSACEKALTLDPDQPSALAGALVSAAILEARTAMASKAFARAKTLLADAKERLNAQRIDGVRLLPELDSALSQTTEELRNKRPSPREIYPRISAAMELLRDQPLSTAALGRAETLLREVLAIQTDEPLALAIIEAVANLKEASAALASQRLDDARSAVRKAEDRLAQKGIESELSAAWRAIEGEQIEGGAL